MSMVLRVDPPYPGESMSSFLGRTAQFYAMHQRVLVSTLMEGARWNAPGRPDLDLRPPDVLEDRLACAVRDWRSPLKDWSGFLGWVLAPTQRHSYCPACFSEDLEHGRTPFFRIDWAPVLVTTCWSHKTPLFNWEAVDSAGARQLPKEWIYKLDNFRRFVPNFMERHLVSLGALDADSGLEHGIRSMLQVICGAQSLIEKPSGASMAGFGYRQSVADCFRWDFSAIVEQSSRFDAGGKSAPLAELARAVGSGEWFGAVPRNARRRTPAYSVFGLRQTGCVRWRRTVQLFAIRALSSVSKYSTLEGLGPDWPRLVPRLDAGFTDRIEVDQTEAWGKVQGVLGHRPTVGVANSLNSAVSTAN